MTVKSEKKVPSSHVQNSAVSRITKNRARRAASGAVRVDVTLNSHVVTMLSELMSHWRCSNRKEAIERAITLAWQGMRR